MEIVGRGRILLWEGASLWLMEALPASERKSTYQRILDRGILAAPAYTIQGGTTEILRGIIARGLGLR